MNDRTQACAPLPPWKILIADDDRDVHTATRMALRGVDYRGRGLEFIDAYSGEETLTLLRANPDTALVFLDVIMESANAGLVAAQRIRESGFDLVRIIIRTGFPGEAPERKIIVDYDIHDYKEKTGLSLQKLFTAVISALRTYADMMSLEQHRRGLMSVLESVSWFDFNAVQRYVAGMVAEFCDLARLQAPLLVVVSRAGKRAAAAPQVVASFGDWPEVGEICATDQLPAPVLGLILASFEQGRALSAGSGATWFSRGDGIELVTFAAGPDPYAEADQVLLDVLLSKVCQALSNHRTFVAVLGERDAVLWGLALRAERWNPGAAVELAALADLATAIARRLVTTLAFPGELDSDFVRDIGVAAALHDLGNEALEVGLLAHNRSFEPDERAAMRVHVSAGRQILESFSAGAAQTAALALAGEVIDAHHERFDGSGYPRRLCGTAIPLAARVVAVADVYIAMTAARPQRPALSAAAACAEISSGKDSHFDPRIVEAFLEVVAAGASG